VKRHWCDKHAFNGQFEPAANPVQATVKVASPSFEQQMTDNIYRMRRHHDAVPTLHRTPLYKEAALLATTGMELAELETLRQQIRTYEAGNGDDDGVLDQVPDKYNFRMKPLKEVSLKINAR
jgi:hypothetical protein